MSSSFDINTLQVVLRKRNAHYRSRSRTGAYALIEAYVGAYVGAYTLIGACALIGAHVGAHVGAYASGVTIHVGVTQREANA